ncbi:helix-turn-helix transcriptional regulator [Cellulosilyticum lentocellum]|uniref:Uncharacterized protein n=1 Tax=Cellulosilyticum lentocellum (strain ATCC 49066 / DSM 5427 / NCIMB 11756 / RHM5) TaxID=642492 RepID=F2JNV5_CELLD|nr:helix-turn-helix domain-containing protein [Cellulosilyticum lentocellum]ADZ82453.1 hypothetical protein Clole_0720 [Cellulosilyticum lentocellum DSM 5427]
MELMKPILEAIREIIREEIQAVPQTKTERWVNSEELCEYLGVSRSWLAHRVKEIPHLKSPVRFKISEVEKWILENEMEETKQQIAATVIKKGKKPNKTFKVV